MMTQILAIASAGGHWVQLMRLRPAFEGMTVTYVTTLDGLPQQFGLDTWALVKECNANTPFAATKCAFQLAVLIIRRRPDAVITTGALPGLIALVLGKSVGARTIWLDSIANADELSAAGKLAGRIADIYLTQWKHLAQDEGPYFLGRVL